VIGNDYVCCFSFAAGLVCFSIIFNLPDFLPVEIFWKAFLTSSTTLFSFIFPAELSIFGYNETVALDQIPLEKDEALLRGFKWQDHLQQTIGKETRTAASIPESISMVEDSITNEILACISCNRNYKITPNELTFYRMMHVPIPRRCFHCRHHARILRRNPLELWQRTCMCTQEDHGHASECPNGFETSYAPDRKEIVYCESCYQKEVQ
jgi:hypothetical protein